MAAYSFIIFGLFPLLAYGQISQQRQLQQSQEIQPQDADDLRWNVNSLEEFMSLLTVNGRPLREDDIFSPHVSEDGKRVITGGGLMASSDECSPRNMSVRLPLNYSDPQVAYYPECTMVQRCGGCCPTRFLSCVPAYKEKIVLKVLRARYLFPGAMSMQWEGFESVEVERHLTCRAVCGLRPEDCGRNKRFLGNQCKCQCLRFSQCYHHQRWDPESCSCRCMHTVNCCDDQEDTRCPFFFDHANCECTPKSMIGASINATQEEIDEWLASNGYEGPDGPVRPFTEPTTTTTTPTTTTTTTTTAAPASRCPSPNPCPRNFVWRMNARGRCMCHFEMARSRFPGRG